jgi:cysteine desulfurase
VRVYLDHNGTSPLRPEVRECLSSLQAQGLGNPSATHASGRRARALIDEARETVARCLDVPEEWVIFTSGGTEANNTALRGVLEASGGGLAISATEHSSVRETAEAWAASGNSLWTIPVQADGRPELAELERIASEPSCRLLSVMAANNEVGSVAPMAAIAEFLAGLGSERPFWHSDCVQMLGKLPLNLRGWGVDLASFSTHKLGGPQGVGILVRRTAVPLAPLMRGGGQEAGARSGTESVASIVAAALSVELACAEQEQLSLRLRALIASLWEGVRSLDPAARLLGPGIDVEHRLPNTLNILFGGVDGRTLLARLDLEGVEASLGSACASGAIEPSHVLLAMGHSEADARAGLRLSVGHNTSDLDIHTAVEIMGKVLCELRESRQSAQ